MATLEQRLAALEGEHRALAERMRRVEAQLRIRRAAPAAAQAPAPPPAPTAAPRSAPLQPQRTRAEAPAALRREVDLEDLLGGRVLALVGGLAVLLGLAFLVALAVERGWLDERARTGLAFAGSILLVVAGAWLHERRGRTQASLAVVGTGVAGLFLSLTAATALYGLVPTGAALVCAFLVGAVAAALAIRWDAVPIGALGILGALGAPILVAATHDAQALAFLAVAHAAAVAVLVWRGWEWLRVAGVALVVLQVGSWVLDAEPGLGLGLAVLALFGALNLAAALGFEFRRCDDARPEATFGLLLGNALFVGVLGSFVGLGGWDGPGSTTAVGWWLAGLALAHVTVGLAVLRARPESRTPAFELLALGLVGANLAFVVLVDGVAVPVGWAAAAAAVAVPARAVTRSAQAVYVVVAAQLLLAGGHILTADAPVEAVLEGRAATVWPILAFGAAAFAVARLTPRDEEQWRAAMDATALSAAAYALAVVLDGVALVGAWALAAAALTEVGRRLGDRVAATGALGFLVLGALHALAYEAPPDALVEGAEPFWSAAAAFAAIAAAAAFAALRGLRLWERDRAALEVVAASSLVYLASVGIVSAFQPGVFDALAGELTVREQGQALLSAFWGALGVALLAAGLRRHRREWRLAGFVLLAVAVGKVFLYDMATLDAGYRVLSFVVLGLLLLAGAYAYQRMRRDETTAAT